MAQPGKSRAFVRRVLRRISNPRSISGQTIVVRVIHVKMFITVLANMAWIFYDCTPPTPLILSNMKIHVLLLLLAPTFLYAETSPGNLADALTALTKVGPEGQGNEAASAAWPVAAGADPKDLPKILAAMKDTNPVSKNWLQSAAMSIAERTQKTPDRLPQAALLEFLDRHSEDPQARELAYDMLVAAKADLVDKLLPTLLNDPSANLRRMAVQRVMDQAKAAPKAEQSVIYTKALASARDDDQVKVIAEELKGFGQEPDLVKHFGFFTNYRIIGPFENMGREGFDKTFPPEKELEFTKSYPGKEGDVSWKEVKVADKLGVLDFNKELKKLKEVTSYAVAEYDSPIEGAAEVRIGTNNAYKLWVNGKFIFGRDEYHRGFRIDQYKLPVTLKKGANILLLKCCQNEETQPWTEEWHFQLRVCDANGTPL
jgi:hypothetical protein